MNTPDRANEGVLERGRGSSTASGRISSAIVTFPDMSDAITAFSVCRSAMSFAVAGPSRARFPSDQFRSALRRNCQAKQATSTDYLATTLPLWTPGQEMLPTSSAKFMSAKISGEAVVTAGRLHRASDDGSRSTYAKRTVAAWRLAQADCLKDGTQPVLCLRDCVIVAASAFSPAFSRSISCAVRKPRRRRPGSGGHQP